MISADAGFMGQNMASLISNCGVYEKFCACTGSRIFKSAMARMPHTPNVKRKGKKIEKIGSLVPVVNSY